jgi:hypothetical protein
MPFDYTGQLPAFTKKKFTNQINGLRIFQRPGQEAEARYRRFLFVDLSFIPIFHWAS